MFGDPEHPRARSAWTRGILLAGLISSSLLGATVGWTQYAATLHSERASKTLALSPREMDGYVPAVAKAFDVPGIAVAVVKDGKVIYERGFGLRDLQGKNPVDRHTKFCIASITKSFTATALEILADRGKLKMSDRVTDHLPWFRMSDPYVTREMRLRDLLAHRSGLGPHAGDLLFLPQTTYSNREVVERLAELPLESSFRDTFNYENILFAAASLVVEQSSGQSYADFVRARIFAPLKMSDAVINAAHLAPADNVATAYEPGPDSALEAIPPIAWENNPGAGGIYASIDDMAKWTRMQLSIVDSDRAGGERRLISAAAQRRMWSMLIPIDIEPQTVPELQVTQPQFLGYAEGWYVSDYRGRRMVWHGGEFPGTVSRLTLIPELRLGVVVLTNQESDGALDAVTLRVLDAYLSTEPTDWIKLLVAAEKLSQARLHARLQADKSDDRPLLTNSAADLRQFAGVYRDNWYGDVAVDLERDGLRILFTHSPRLIGSMLLISGNKFLVRWDDRALRADAIVEFDMDKSGAVQGAHMARASAAVSKAYDYQDLRLVKVGGTATTGTTSNPAAANEHVP
jgi:CubicO group peptidase (beta-lactamase class C family)